MDTTAIEKLIAERARERLFQAAEEIARAFLDMRISVMQLARIVADINRRLGYPYYPEPSGPRRAAAIRTGRRKARKRRRLRRRSRR